MNTPYAIKNCKDGWMLELLKRKKVYSWWLRTTESGEALFVDSNGEIKKCQGNSWGIRPAIQIDI